MTLRVHASLTADGSQAKTEIGAVAKSADALEAEMAQVNKMAADQTAIFAKLGAEAKGLGAGVSDFNAPLSETAKTTKGLPAPLSDTADGMDRVSRSSTAAAGSVGNMAAQFNDIIVMMAAGQNPLQLAIQQGTQITQAFGGRGAAGAARMLWAGFTSLFSPINLITIGSIAAGAAMVQWLSGAIGGAESLEDRIESLQNATSEYRDLVSRDLDDLKERYGAITPEVIQLQRETEKAALDEMLTRAKDAAEGLKEELSDGGQMFRLFRPDGDTDRRSARTGRSDTVDELKTMLGQVGGDGDLNEQIAAVETFKTAVYDAAGGWEGMNKEQRAFVAQINMVLDDLRASLGAIQQNWGKVQEGWEGIKGIWDAGKERVQESIKQVEAEREILRTLQDRADLAQLINTYGEDSKKVAEERAAQEAEALRRMIEESVQSEALKEQALAVVDALVQAGNVDLASNLAKGRAEAAAMADEIQRAVNGMLSLHAQGIASLRESELRLQYKDDPVALAGALAAERFDQVDTSGLDPILRDQMDARRDEAISNAEETARNREELVAWQKAQTEAARSARSGAKSAANDAKKQAEAVDKLIGRMRTEVEVLKEMDPIQRELIQNRDVLSHATAAQTAEVKKLLEEEQKLTELQDRADWFKSTSYDLIMDLKEGGDAVADSFERVASAIEDAAWQAILLGEGPFGSAFGAAGDGLLGSLSKALFPQNAEGGMFYTDGHGTADKGLSWLSSGEFIVNAQATSRHRALLEAINSGGSLPAFAAGGAYNAGPTPAYGAPVFQIINQSSVPVTGTVQETQGAGGQRAYKMVLADQVGDAMNTPGGGARRVMKQGYGLQKRGALR